MPLHMKKHRTDHHPESENHGDALPVWPDRRRLRNLPSGCGIVRSQPAVVPRRGSLPSRAHGHSNCSRYSHATVPPVVSFNLFAGPGRPGGCSAGHDERPGCSIPAKASVDAGDYSVHPWRPVSGTSERAMFQHILCPIDFTSFSDRAVRQAVAIARCEKHRSQGST